MIRLVIIDDHEMVREGLKAMLVTEPDFHIVGDAADAQQALLLIEQTKPDIALLDVRLPGGMSGIEACRIITKRYPHTAVIILTTFTDEELIAQCIQAGARGFIVKDVERFDLKRSIRAVARGEAAIDSKAAVAVLARLRRASSVEPASPPEPLSAQQLVILRLVAQGLSSREIASQLYLSENTVKGYVQDILHRLNVKNRTEAVMVAVKQGWL
jgi:DNA-binding NarL/FixJ family response regulator